MTLFFSTVLLAPWYLRKILQVIFYECPAVCDVTTTIDPAIADTLGYFCVFNFCLVQTVLQFVNLTFLAQRKTYLIC